MICASGGGIENQIYQMPLCDILAAQLLSVTSGQVTELALSCASSKIDLSPQLTG